MSPARELLRRMPGIQTSDPAEMRNVLFTAFGANSFDFSTEEKFEAGVDFIQLEDIGIGSCRYSTSTTVGFLEGDFVRLQIARKGRAETTISGKHYAIDGPTGCVIPSGQPLQASFGKHFEQLLVRIKTDALERKLAAILGAKPKGRLEFSPAIDLSGPYGQSLHQIIRFFSEQLVATRLPPRTLQNLQNAVTSAFLYAARHAFSARLDNNDTPEASPQYLRRAEEYIEAHWNEGVSVEKLTEVTGQSARAIFNAFRQYRGYSPMAFEKTVRLKHANELLKVPHPRTTVTGVALACGFSNLGHFAKDYRAMFKEQPSDTIRRWK
jgi:AraC-like DNA-binding protein